MTVISINAGPVTLEGFLYLPENATGLVLFVHGSGSSRHSLRNKAVAEEFNDYGLATLLFDLLTEEEEKIDLVTRHLRFDMTLLAERVLLTTKWIQNHEHTSKMKIGYIGSSTGAAAALVAASSTGNAVSAIVSRGGRPDLAGEALRKVKAPTLFIVGENDDAVLSLNQQALAELNCIKKLAIVPGATHLFEEKGTLEQASHMARHWFLQYL